MVKFGVFLLLTAALLHSHVDAAHERIYSSPNFKKATVNVTTEEEWKEVNATVDYATALLSSNNAKLSEIKVWGEELMDEVNRLHVLEAVVLFSKKWKYSHFQMCTKVAVNETSKYYEYKMSLTNDYRNLYGILERMPNASGIDLKRLNKYFSYISYETFQQHVNFETYYLFKHLQCLRNVIRSSDKFVMNDIKEVYESYQHLNKIKEENDLADLLKRLMDISVQKRSNFNYFIYGLLFGAVLFMLYKVYDAIFSEI